LTGLPYKLAPLARFKFQLPKVSDKSTPAFSLSRLSQIFLPSLFLSESHIPRSKKRSPIYEEIRNRRCVGGCRNGLQLLCRFHLQHQESAPSSKDSSAWALISNSKRNSRSKFWLFWGNQLFLCLIWFNWWWLCRSLMVNPKREMTRRINSHRDLMDWDLLKLSSPHTDDEIL